MKKTELEKILDRTLGPEGTPLRDEMEKKVKEHLKELDEWKKKNFTRYIAERALLAEMFTEC